MVHYSKDAVIPAGTRVMVPTGAEGVVVYMPADKNTWSVYLPGTRITWVKVEDYAPFGYYTDRLEMIEVSKRELVGPKPKPVEEPEHPTPWTVSGNRLLDANGKEVFRLIPGGYDRGLNRAVPLAKIVRDAVNEKFKEEDAPAPW